MSEDKWGEMSQEELVKELEKLNETLEGAQARLKEVNAESAGRRKELEALKADEEKQLSEVEKLQKEVAAMKARDEQRDKENRALKIKSAVMEKINECGFANPVDAFTLLDLSSVEIADDGEVKGFEKSVQALVESGRLPMAEQKKGDGLGTPRGKGKPTGDDHKEQVAPIIRM